MTTALAIGEREFDVKGSAEKMSVRVYAPTRQPDAEGWTCAYSIDAPLSVTAEGSGKTSLLALVEALRGISRALYGSAEYRAGLLDRQLVFPATSDLLDIAPFPF
jgi:hypothetical protein